MPTAKPHILIVGAGFGGVYTARWLCRWLDDSADITILGRENHFLFTPLLHEVATGSLSPESVVEPVAEIFRGTSVRFIQAEATKVDLEARRVEADGRDFSYDYLVVASGAATNMYGIPGVEENCLMLKRLDDAVAIRKRVIESIRRASGARDGDERRRLLSFAVVGGGPTGVELAAELHEFVQQVASEYYAEALDHREISITLVSASPELLPQFSPKVRAKALEVLSKKGIEILLNTAVSAVTSAGISAKDGPMNTRFIPAGLVVWVAGVAPSLPPMQGETHMHKTGRLIVDRNLRVEGHADAFAVGDGAVIAPREGEAPTPMLAQAAEQEAKVAAWNIASLIEGRPGKLREFSFRSKGMLISLGAWQAAGDIMGLHLSGPVMWWVWRTIYLSKFNSWRKRLEIAFEWTVNLFTPRDITEI